jgi:hypothetical protein
MDQELQTALKQARGGKPLRFAFVANPTKGKLLVARQLPPKRVAEARKEAGGGAVFQGRCVGEDGTLFFEVAKEPPATLAGQLKRRIKEEAGLSWPVEIRVKADAEAEPADEAQQPGAPPPPPPGADGAAVMKRLGTLTPTIKAALAGPNASRVQALTVAANGLIKNKDFLQADKVLDELEPLLKAPPPPPPPPPGADGAAVMKRLGTLSPTIKAALAGPNAARVQALTVAANGLIKNKDFLQAGKILDELEPLLKAPPPPPPPPPGADGAAVMKRLGALTAAIKAALAGPNASRVQALMVAANGLIKNKDFPQAGKVLDELEPLLKAPPPPPPPPPAADGAGVVKRLNGLAGAIKAALAGPNASRVQALAGAVNGLVRNKDYAQAGKVLDELEPLLRAPVPPPPPPPPPGAGVVKRLNGLAGAIKAALAGPNASRVQALAGAVNGLVRNKDYAQAAQVLDELEPLLGAAPGTPPGRAPEAAPEAAPQVGGIGDARARWRDAREAVGVDVGKLQDALRQEGDPRLDRIADMGLNGITGRLQVGLEVALLDLERGGGDRTKALKSVEELRKFLAENKIIALCEGNPFGVAVKIREPLLAALGDLEKVLTA